MNIMYNSVLSVISWVCVLDRGWMEHLCLFLPIDTRCEGSDEIYITVKGTDSSIIQVPHVSDV